jgi:type IV pilus assembly protein PilY1
VIQSFSTTRSVVADVALIGVATPGVVDHAYAVDTGGNIYRIDFKSSSTNWVMNKVAYTNGAGRKFLFAPALAAASGGYVYVALGSGDREHPLQSEYPYSSTMVNRFYVYQDNLATTSATNLDDTTLMDDYTAATTCTTPQVLPGSSKKGWFMNLTQYGIGEQAVTSALIVSGLVTFSTNRPIPATQGTCSTTLGEARGYWVDLLNASGAIGVPGTCGGTRSSLILGGGLPASPVLATVTPTIVTSGQSTGGGQPVASGQPTTVVFGTVSRSGPGPDSSLPPRQPPLTIVPTRKKLYWKSSGEN